MYGATTRSGTVVRINVSHVQRGTTFYQAGQHEGGGYPFAVESTVNCCLARGQKPLMPSASQPDWG